VDRGVRSNGAELDAALAPSISCELSSLPACRYAIRSSSKLWSVNPGCAFMLSSVSALAGDDGTFVVGRLITISVGRVFGLSGGM